MASKQRIGVYPGTFDPMTLGHLDIIKRGAHLVDRLVVGVTTNPSKEPMFTVAERLEMVRREVADMPGVSVVEFDSLLMDFAEREGAAHPEQHVAFVVGDLDAVRGRAVEVGAPWDDLSAGRAKLRDPAGNLVELFAEGSPRA